MVAADGVEEASGRGRCRRAWSLQIICAIFVVIFEFVLVVGLVVKIDPDQAVAVNWVYKTQRRYVDKYTWVTVLAASDITLIVKKKGEEIAALQFDPGTAHRVHPPEPQKTGPGGRALEDGESVWKVDAAFLPYQGVFLDWYPAPTGGRKP